MWTATLRVTHEAVSAVLTGIDRALVAAEGKVAIDLGDIGAVVGERVEATGLDLPLTNRLPFSPLVGAKLGAIRGGLLQTTMTVADTTRSNCRLGGLPWIAVNTACRSTDHEVGDSSSPGRVERKTRSETFLKSHRHRLDVGLHDDCNPLATNLRSVCEVEDRGAHSEMFERSLKNLKVLARHCFPGLSAAMSG